MNRYHIYFIWVIYATLLCACNKPDNKTALNDLVKRHPELFPNLTIDDYRITRTLYDGRDSIYFQLLENGYKNDKGKIVILSNNKKETYAIPFPDREYKSYWCFYGCKTTTGINTFKTELQHALKKLSINKAWQANSLLDNLFISLLGTRRTLAPDSTTLKGWENTHMSQDCADTLKRNYIAITKDMNTELWFYDYRVYADSYMIFKHAITYTKNESFNVNIEVYKNPCIIKPLYID